MDTFLFEHEHSYRRQQEESKKRLEDLGSAGGYIAWIPSCLSMSTATGGSKKRARSGWKIWEVLEDI